MSNSSYQPSSANLMKYLIPAAIAFLAIVALVTAFSTFNNVQKTMVAKETALSAQYQDNQNELSTYIVSIKEAMGVADRSTDQLDRVLQDAVKGRYDKAGAPSGGQMMSAIVEAYPDLKGAADSYAKVQDAVLSGRTAYKNKQSKLLDMLRDYDSWRNSGLLNSQFTKMMGAPSENLVARVGDQSWRGKDAEEKMFQIVLVKDAKDSYNSGELEPLDVNPKSVQMTPTASSKAVK